MYRTMPKHTFPDHKRMFAYAARPDGRVLSSNHPAQARTHRATATRLVIPLISAALALGACSQNVWKADRSRYPTKAQQEAAFERHSDRCQASSRVVRITSSTTMTDTQAYRPAHHVEYNRTLYRSCMEAAGFMLAGSNQKKQAPPPPEKTADKPEAVAMEKMGEAETLAPAIPAPTPGAPPPAAPPQTVTMPEPAPPAESTPATESTPSAESTPPAEKTPAAEKTPPAASLAAANTPFRVQVGSFTTRAAAEKEWARLQTALPEIFASQEPIIAKATLPGRGTVYRLQRGGFDTMQEARTMCATLRAKQQACFPLRKS